MLMRSALCIRIRDKYLTCTHRMLCPLGRMGGEKAELAICTGESKMQLLRGCRIEGKRLPQLHMSLTMGCAYMAQLRSLSSILCFACQAAGYSSTFLCPAPSSAAAWNSIRPTCLLAHALATPSPFVSSHPTYPFHQGYAGSDPPEGPHYH